MKRWCCSGPWCRSSSVRVNRQASAALDPRLSGGVRLNHRSEFMTSPTLQVAVTDAVALVKIAGRASFNCSVDFKTLVYELRDRGYRKFVLDLSECLIL